MTFDGTKFLGCSDEQKFKMQFIKEALPKKDYTALCIETEETVKGFPDVLVVEKKTGLIHFREFKFARNGKITFQPSQPAFYREHPEMWIYIVAFDPKKCFVHIFDSKCLFDEYSPYKMNEHGEVIL